MHELVMVLGPVPRLIFDALVDMVLPASKHRNDERHIAVNGEGGETKREWIPEEYQNPEAEADIVMTEDGGDDQNEEVTKMVVTMVRTVGTCLDTALKFCR